MTHYTTWRIYAEPVVIYNLAGTNLSPRNIKYLEGMHIYRFIQRLPNCLPQQKMGNNSRQSWALRNLGSQLRNLRTTLLVAELRIGYRAQKVAELRVTEAKHSKAQPLPGPPPLTGAPLQCLSRHSIFTPYSAQIHKITS